MNLKLKGVLLTLTIFSFTFLAVACSSSADRIRGGEELEVWKKDEKGNDIFYMKISGSASQAAKDSGEEARMKATCVESTKLQAKDTIIRKLVGEIIQSVSATADAETSKQIILSMRKGSIRGTELKECAALTRKWSTCECVHFVQGRNLRRKFKLQVEKLAKDAGL